MRNFICYLFIGILFSFSNCSHPAQLLAEPTFLTALDKNSIEEGQIIQVKNLSFRADSVEISTTHYEALGRLSNFLKQSPNITIEVGGHTNNIPPDKYCDEISTIRAENIAKYLVRKGIDKDRISIKGYGKTQPIASNKNVAGRRINQRVEIKIIRIREEKFA